MACIRLRIIYFIRYNNKKYEYKYGNLFRKLSKNIHNNAEIKYYCFELIWW